MVHMQAVVESFTCFYRFEEPEQAGCLPYAREGDAEGLHLQEEFLRQPLTPGLVLTEISCAGSSS